ncbi:TPA: hypothetical protein VMX41_001799 [Streptococcus pyogenes]|nr:hypothetical protein [Streptococcus pyogenes]
MRVLLVPFSWLLVAMPAQAQTPTKAGIGDWIGALVSAAFLACAAVAIWLLAKKLFVDTKPRDTAVNAMAHAIKTKRRWDAFVGEARDKAGRL